MRVVRTSLATADGLSLEAELAVPEDARAGAVLAHPHPQYGGDMRTSAVAALFERLPEDGVAALRFNFRGVGASEGTFDDGRGERLDFEAALGALCDAIEAVDAPVLAAGSSFGADVSLSVADERLA